jgi:hypothetical protein
VTESEAIAIADKYAEDHQLPHQRVRQTVFIPLDHPFHNSWENEVWLIFFDDIVPRPAGVEDFGGLLIRVDCATGTAELHRPL